MTKKEKEIEDRYLNKAFEINALYQALSEMIYIHSHPEVIHGSRNNNVRREFGIALVKLGIIK